MIETVYDKEKEQLRILINSKSILQNISYKLIHDKNSIEFFDNLIDNISKYDTLSDEVTEDRMKKYYFKNDFFEMYEVLYLFFKGLTVNEYIKDKSSIELRKCCNVFPDKIGERILILISHLPLMELFSKKIKFEEYIKGKTTEEKIMGQTIKEYQEEQLFSEHTLIRNLFPEDKEFIDYDMKNRYIQKLENNFNKEEIENSIEILLKLYKDNEDLKETKIIVGMTFWEEKKSLSTQNTELFKNAIKTIFKSLKNDF